MVDDDPGRRVEAVARAVMNLHTAVRELFEDLSAGAGDATSLRRALGSAGADDRSVANSARFLTWLLHDGSDQPGNSAEHLVACSFCRQAARADRIVMGQDASICAVCAMQLTLMTPMTGDVGVLAPLRCGFCAMAPSEAPGAVYPDPWQRRLICEECLALARTILAEMADGSG
jgi:hypothetical protein